MIFDTSNSFPLMFVMENVTLILTIIPLAIFLAIITITKRIKSFHFQILIFIILYFIGELIENNQVRNAFFTSVPSDVGPLLHVIAAIFFTVIMILRFYSARQAGKKISDEIK